MARGLRRRNAAIDEQEPPPGTERVRWWKARLKAAATRGEAMEIPPGNMAAVLARFELSREMPTKGAKK